MSCAVANVLLFAGIPRTSTGSRVTVIHRRPKHESNCVLMSQPNVPPPMVGAGEALLGIFAATDGTEQQRRDALAFVTTRLSVLVRRKMSDHVAGRSAPEETVLMWAGVWARDLFQVAPNSRWS